MEDELDDIMDQFLEMERELGSVGESDTVKLRKKSPVTSVSYVHLFVEDRNGGPHGVNTAKFGLSQFRPWFVFLECS